MPFVITKNNSQKTGVFLNESNVKDDLKKTIKIHTYKQTKKTTTTELLYLFGDSLYSLSWGKFEVDCDADTFAQKDKNYRQVIF